MAGRMSPKDNSDSRLARVKKFGRQSTSRKLRDIRKRLNVTIPDRIPAEPGMLTGGEAVIAPFPPPAKTVLTPAAKRKRSLV